MNVSVLSDVAVSPNREAGDSSWCAAYPLSAALQDGAVMTVYRVGVQKHSSDGAIVAQRSADRGASWSLPRTVFDGTGGNPTLTAVTGGIVQTRAGSLVGALGAVESLPADLYMFSEAGRRLPRRIPLVRSRDGEDWETGGTLPTGALRNPGISSRPVLASDGSVLILLEHKNNQGAQATAVVRSDPDARTFGPPLVVASDDEGRMSLCDGRAAALPDGRILLFLWTFRTVDEETVEVRCCESVDDGRTWSEPEPTGFVGQVTAALALPSGRVLALTNVRTGPRPGIRLGLSDHTGMHWPAQQWIQMWDAAAQQILAEPLSRAEGAADVEGGSAVWDELQRFSFGTPDLVALPDGDLLMTYYATQEDVVHVRACRFRL